jgi:hypothetical protein
VSRIIVSSLVLSLTVCYECLWCYQALQFGAKGAIVLISCDFCARKTLHCVVLLKAVVSCALNQSAEPVCSCEIGAAVGAPGNPKPLNSLASSNLRGDDGSAPSTHRRVAPVRTCIDLRQQSGGK